MLEYMIATIRIPSIDFKTSKPIEAILTCKLYIVDSLDTNILISTNMIVPKKINLLIGNKKMKISLCKANANI